MEEKDKYQSMMGISMGQRIIMHTESSNRSTRKNIERLTGKNISLQQNYLDCVKYQPTMGTFAGERNFRLTEKKIKRLLDIRLQKKTDINFMIK